MSEYKKEIAKAVMVILLVALLSITVCYFVPEYLPRSAYATGISIQEEEQATEDFIGEICSSGGAVITVSTKPYVRLYFEDWTEQDAPSDPDWSGSEGTVNASEVKEIHVSCSTIGWTSAYSEEFMNFTVAGNFSWFGDYKYDREMQSHLHVKDETTDLGSSFEANILFTLDLNADTVMPPWRDVIHCPTYDDYKYLPPELRPVFNKSGLWRWYHTWIIETPQLSEMVGEAESASIIFNGSVWLDGNYTVTVNGVTEHKTTNLLKNITFGRIDATFEDGEITTLTFTFNEIYIILFAYPQEQNA